MTGTVEIVMTAPSKPRRTASIWVRKADDAWTQGQRGWLMSSAASDGLVLVGWNRSGMSWSWVPLADIELA